MGQRKQTINTKFGIMVYKSPDVNVIEELKFLNETESNLENACDLGVYFDHKLI